jgi:hypothetical protein
MAVKKWWRRRSVRAALVRGEKRREGEWGEVRWRMVELSLYIGAKGEGGGW